MSLLRAPQTVARKTVTRERLVRDMMSDGMRLERLFFDITLINPLSRLCLLGALTGALTGCDDSSSSASSDRPGGSMAAGALGDSQVSAGAEISAGVDVSAGIDVSAGVEISAGAEVSAGTEISAGVEGLAGSTTEFEVHRYPAPPRGYPRFRFPVADHDRAQINPDPVFGVDHDTRSESRIQCLNYEGRGFPYCYDGHLGSDFMLLGGFDAMDAGSAQVVAALAGEVIAAVDGNYDRCRADLLSGDVTCDGEPMRANYVTIRHDGGWRSSYYHLKRGSVLVERGQRVNCGEPLGLIGSSGYSSAPHLHFEVEDSTGLVWDPYAGPESQSFSLWVYQPSDESSSSDTSDNAASLPSSSCSSPSK